MNLSRRLWRHIEGLHRSRNGAAAVELAILLPLLVGMIAPLVDLGMGAYAKMQLQSAVQAGAGNALTAGFNPNTITSIVQTNGASLTNLQVTPSPTQRCGCATSSDTIVYSTSQSPPNCNPPCPSGGTGKVGVYVTVNATADYHPLLSYPGIASTVSLSAQSVVRIQ